MVERRLNRRQFGKILGAAGLGSALDPVGAEAQQSEARAQVDALRYLTRDEAAFVDAAVEGSHYSISPYQSTHNCGGAIMGSDPSTSALNRYLQSWDVPNFFAVGASAFPQNAGYNPTGPVGALAYWAADAIVTTYQKSPGALV